MNVCMYVCKSVHGQQKKAAYSADRVEQTSPAEGATGFLAGLNSELALLLTDRMGNRFQLLLALHFL